jgi:hypothetical protein
LTAFSQVWLSDAAFETLVESPANETSVIPAYALQLCACEGDAAVELLPNSIRFIAREMMPQLSFLPSDSSSSSSSGRSSCRSLCFCSSRRRGQLPPQQPLPLQPHQLACLLA